MNHIQTKAVRSGKTSLIVLYFLSGILFSGCAGGEAKNLANALETTARTVAEEVGKMQVANETLYNQLVATQQLTSRLAAESGANSTVLELQIAHQAQLQELEETYREELTLVLTSSDTYLKDARDQISQTLTPLTERVESLQQSAEQSVGDINSQDIEIRTPALVRQTQYLAAFAALREIEREALASLIQRFSVIENEAVTRLETVYESQRTNLNRQLENFSAMIAAGGQNGGRQITIADAPKGYDELIQYLGAVEASGTAFAQYVAITGFGRGSLFDSAVNGLLQGGVQGLSGQRGTVAEVRENAKPVLSSLGAAARNAIRTAGDTATGALRETASSAITSLKNEVMTRLDDVQNRMDESLRSTPQPEEE